MKIIQKLFIVLTASVTFTACYDDTELWSELERHERRIAKLESLCGELNTNITALQTIVEALQKNAYVTDVVPISKDGETVGYTIKFTTLPSITVYCGEEIGYDNEEYVPVIGVSLANDGIYYWTINGEWLLDDDGNRIPTTGKDGADGTNGSDGRDGADGENGKDGTDGRDGVDGENGKDGADGVTPQLKIQDDYWYVSYDGGSTWKILGKATGEDGAPGKDGDDGTSAEVFFQYVEHDEDFVYFMLADGTVLTLPKFKGEDLPEVDENRKIYYTTIDNKKIFPASQLVIDAVLISNKYVDGQGVMIFDDEVTELGFGTFSGIQSLSSIVLPESVSSIGQHTFYDCPMLEEIHLKSVIPPHPEIVSSYYTWEPFYNNAQGRKIYVPTESLEKYRGKEKWSDYAHAIFADGDDSAEIEMTKIRYVTSDNTVLYPLTPEEFGMAKFVESTYDASLGEGYFVFEGPVTVLPTGAFEYCSNLVEIDIPASVTTIQGPFIHSGLEKVHITDLSAWLRIDMSPGAVEDIDLYLNGEKLTDLIIPSDITEIKDYAFLGCDGLESVQMHDGVTSVGDRAFQDCSNLKNVDFSSAIKYIGVRAFENCTSLTAIELPEGITSIETHTFRYCTSLATVKLSEGITSIGDDAFCGCTSLATVKLSEGITSIGDDAFCGCRSLTVIDFPESVTTIGNNAFGSCINMELDVTSFSTNWKEIGNSAFDDCQKIIGDLNLFAVESLGEGAFSSCYNIKSVIIGNECHSSLKSCFDNCHALESVVLGDGITDILSYAFGYCNQLKEITVGTSVSYIDYKAFVDTTIEKVNISDLSAWLKIQYYSETSNPLQGGGDLYLNGNIVTAVEVPSDITEINAYAFYGCPSIKNIVFHDNLTSIGDYAFCGPSEIEDVIIPESVTYLGYSSIQSNSLAKVYCRPVTPPEMGSYTIGGIFEPYTKYGCFANMGGGTYKVYVPASSLNSYKEAKGWSNYSDLIFAM